MSPYKKAKARGKAGKKLEQAEKKRQFIINQNICPECGKDLYERKTPFFEKYFGEFSDYQIYCKDHGVMDCNVTISY